MHWKTTVVLLLLTLGIGAYISLYEIKQPPPEERERLSKQVVDLSFESVTQITLELPQARVRVVRDGTLWRLEPRPAPPTHDAMAGRMRADTELIQRLLHHTNPLMAQRTLTGSAEHPLDLAGFGLAPALGQITWMVDGHPVTLLVGETTPVGASRYAQLVGRDEVFVIPPDVFDDANRPPDIFRDPRLLRFSTWGVDRILLTTPASEAELTRQGTAWRLTRPLTDQADESAVETLLRNLVGLRIKRYVDDAPAVEQLAAWGLDHPTLELTLTFQQPSGKHLTVFFGKPLPDDAGLTYAKRSDEPALYAVAAVDAQALIQDPNTLRDKACVTFFMNEVSRVELTRSDTSWTIERLDGTWKQAGSEAALASAPIEEFLRTLSGVRLSGFVEESPDDLVRYGLAPPAATVTVWTKPAEAPQRLLIGSTVPGSTERYGRIEGRAAVIRLPESISPLIATKAERVLTVTTPALE